MGMVCFSSFFGAVMKGKISYSAWVLVLSFILGACSDDSSSESGTIVSPEPNPNDSLIVDDSIPQVYSSSLENLLSSSVVVEMSSANVVVSSALVDVSSSSMAVLSSSAEEISSSSVDERIPVSPNYSLLDVPNGQPKVDAVFWKNAISNVWSGIKKRNIAPFSNGAGLIHRPKSEYPGDAVSEGVGYGMLLALYANDQQTFNTMFEMANEKMWAGCYYNWQMGPDGNIKGTGAASDAEEDVALALVFADKLVEKGMWTAYTSNKLQKTYMEQAKKIMRCMWETKQITDQGNLAPGAEWGGDNFVNPGYFSPAWYRIFAKIDTEHDWNKVIDRSYQTLANSPGYNYGMVPDWMQPDGGYTGSLGYNAYFEGHAFYKDAIRILWRVAIDAVWFNETRAKTFLKNALNFITEKGGAGASNFYQMDGALLPESDVWKDLNGGKISRNRREHSHLTTGMWATAALAVGSDEDKISFSTELAKFYEKDDADYFGNAVDPLGGTEDTLHNEMYFDQFLAWFGASMLSGTFTNVLSNLDTPQADSPGIQSEELKYIRKKN